MFPFRFTSCSFEYIYPYIDLVAVGYTILILFLNEQQRSGERLRSVSVNSYVFFLQQSTEHISAESRIFQIFEKFILLSRQLMNWKSVIYGILLL